MLLAIVGKKRSGKNEAASVLAERHNAESFALADPIKYALLKGLRVANVLKSGPTLADRSYFTYEDINGETSYDRESRLRIDCATARKILSVAWDTVCEERHLNLTDTAKGITLICDITSIKGVEWSIRKLMQVFGTDVGVAVDEMIWMRYFADKYLTCISKNTPLIITDCRQVHEIQVMREMGAKVLHVQRPLTDNSNDTHITEQGLPVCSGDTVIVNDSTLQQFHEKVESWL